MERDLLDRRSVLTGLGAAGASLWIPPSAEALGLPEDQIKVIRYYRNAGDAGGRGGQPMVNQSTNVVMIETETGLSGVGEGGELLTQIGEYDTYRAWMLMNRRPDGSFMNW